MTEETKIEEPVAESAAPVEQEVQETVAESPKDIQSNWEQTRQTISALKQQNEQLHAQMMQLSQMVKPLTEEKDELEELDPNEVITVEQYKKGVEKHAKKYAQQEIQQYMRQHSLETSEQQMRASNEDYDYVLENFAIPLIKNDPALAYKVQNSKNPAKTAYQLGKLSDEYQASAQQQSQPSPKAQKILKNTSRPVAAASVGAPLKSQVEDFSKMSQNQIWELSQQYARKA